METVAFGLGIGPDKVRYLERHAAIERGVERLVERTHSAAAKSTLDLVATEGRRRHGCLAPGRRQAWGRALLAHGFDIEPHRLGGGDVELFGRFGARLLLWEEDLGVGGRVEQVVGH